MRYLLIVAMMFACGDSASATTVLPTTTDVEVTSTSDQTSTSSTSWLTTAPTTGDPPTCQRDLCSDLDAWCHKYGITDSICSTISESICPGDPCVACEMAPKRCKFGDEACKAEANKICAGVDQCECEYSCETTVDELPVEKQVALCFVYPWIIGEWCDEPDEAQCLAVMQGPCAPTACEYFDCLAALEEHPCEVPPECAPMSACSNLN